MDAYATANQSTHDPPDPNDLSADTMVHGFHRDGEDAIRATQAIQGGQPLDDTFEDGTTGIPHIMNAGVRRGGAGVCLTKAYIASRCMDSGRWLRPTDKEVFKALLRRGRSGGFGLHEDTPAYFQSGQVGTGMYEGRDGERYLTDGPGLSGMAMHFLNNTVFEIQAFEAMLQEALELAQGGSSNRDTRTAMAAELLRSDNRFAAPNVAGVAIARRFPEDDFYVSTSAPVIRDLVRRCREILLHEYEGAGSKHAQTQNTSGQQANRRANLVVRDDDARLNFRKTIERFSTTKDSCVGTVLIDRVAFEGNFGITWGRIGVTNHDHTRGLGRVSPPTGNSTPSGNRSPRTQGDGPTSGGSPPPAGSPPADRSPPPSAKATSRAPYIRRDGGSPQSPQSFEVSSLSRVSPTLLENEMDRMRQDNHAVQQQMASVQQAQEEMIRMLAALTAQSGGPPTIPEDVPSRK